MHRFKNKGIRIGILRGGNHEDYNLSIKKGGEFISHIFENYYPKYKPIDIFIDKDNSWHMGGILIKPNDLIHKVDLVWDMTCPLISQVIKNFKIPNIAHKPFPFLIKKNKNFLKNHMKDIDVRVPNSIVFPIYQEDIDKDLESHSIEKAKEVYNKFSPPYIVRPFNKDYDEAIHVVKTFPILIENFKNLFKKGDSILVEELIKGRNVKMHILKNYRNQEIYHFPIIDKISRKEREILADKAKKIFNHMYDINYLKLDFNIHPNLGIYLNEINYMPDIISDTHFIESINASGSKKRDIFEHIIKENL